MIDEIPKSKLPDFVDALPSFEAADMELFSDHKIQSAIVPIKEYELTTGTEEEKLEGDFELVRSNLSTLAAKSTSIVDELLALAQATESPRAFEVLATTINTLVGINKDLLDTHSKRADILKKLGKSNQPEHQTNIQNNFEFVGSSKELLELIKK